MSIIAEERAAAIAARANEMVREVMVAAKCSRWRAVKSLRASWAEGIADAVAAGRPLYPGQAELYREFAAMERLGGR